MFEPCRTQEWGGGAGRTGREAPNGPAPHARLLREPVPRAGHAPAAAITRAGVTTIADAVSPRPAKGSSCPRGAFEPMSFMCPPCFPAQLHTACTHSCTPPPRLRLPIPAATCFPDPLTMIKSVPNGLLASAMPSGRNRKGRRAPWHRWTAWAARYTIPPMVQSYS